MIAALLSLSWVLIGLESATIHVQPQLARPGDAIVIDVAGATSSPEGTLRDLALQFLPTPQGFRAITGLPVEFEAGNADISVELDDGTKLKASIHIRDPDFNKRSLSVARKYTSPPAKVRRWMAEDKVAFAKAFATRTNRWHFEGDFEWPRKALVTAPFGDLRVFNGKKQSQHFGTDIEGQVGDEVLAAQSGKVVLRRNCYAAGQAIVLHHGGSLFSAYFHLSEFSVELGESVEKGQRLGRVGQTGRVTGPHLHWGVKADNRWMNAESLLRLKLEARTYPETSASPDRATDEWHPDAGVFP